MPALDRPLVLIFAGNHGVVAQGVSAYPPSVTQAMVDNFGAGGAAINQICKTFALDLKVVPLDLATATEDFTLAPAMSEADSGGLFRPRHGRVPADADLVVDRRNGHRQYDERRGDLCGALRRRCRLLGRAGHGRR